MAKLVKTPKPSNIFCLPFFFLLCRRYFFVVIGFEIPYTFSNEIPEK